MIAGASSVDAQSSSVNQQPPSQADTPAVTRGPEGKSYTLRVTTREVVIEVVARDHDDHPVNDLTENDFQIFESTHKSKDEMKEISAFRKIDPAAETNNLGDRGQGVVLPLGGRCEIRSTVHYEIAFHPAQWTSGYHTMLVTTTRKRVKLSYRSQFYVGLSDTLARRSNRNAKEIESQLMAAACYHANIPSSLSLSAVRLDSQNASQFRFVLKVAPTSLDLAGVNDDSRQVQLEYGICSFSRSGQVLGYWHFTDDRATTPDELSDVLANGWNETLELPRSGNPSLARFVVLEPKSGNLGTVELTTDLRLDPKVRDELTEPNTSETDRAIYALAASEPEGAQMKRRKTLGSPLPKPNALCGDVYELPTTTTFLPSDFRKLNAVGALYADSLDVPEQILSDGLPGATARSEWFGIDYYGEFWVSTPGKYQFVLNADDGADLYIDDHMLINDDGIHPPRRMNAPVTLSAGRHTIHLPYFQGPTYVDLTLEVREPGGELKVFSVRNFSRP